MLWIWVGECWAQVPLKSAWVYWFVNACLYPIITSTYDKQQRLKESSWQFFKNKKQANKNCRNRSQQVYRKLWFFKNPCGYLRDRLLPTHFQLKSHQNVVSLLSPFKGFLSRPRVFSWTTWPKTLWPRGITRPTDLSQVKVEERDHEHDICTKTRLKEKKTSLKESSFLRPRCPW